MPADVIKKKLQHKITQNSLIMKGHIKEEEDDDKKEDETKKDFPQENIEKLLKSIGLAENVPKLKECEIAEPEVFFELSEDTIIGCLDIKTEGKKYRFKEKLKEVKDKHEKAKAKKEEEMSEIVGETFEQLQKKASVIF